MLVVQKTKIQAKGFSGPLQLRFLLAYYGSTILIQTIHDLDVIENFIHIKNHADRIQINTCSFSKHLSWKKYECCFFTLDWAFSQYTGCQSNINSHLTNVIFGVVQVQNVICNVSGLDHCSKSGMGQQRRQERTKMERIQFP